MVIAVSETSSLFPHGDVNPLLRALAPEKNSRDLTTSPGPACCLWSSASPWEFLIFSLYRSASSSVRYVCKSLPQLFRAPDLLMIVAVPLHFSSSSLRCLSSSASARPPPHSTPLSAASRPTGCAPACTPSSAPSNGPVWSPAPPA